MGIGGAPTAMPDSHRMSMAMTYILNAKDMPILALRTNPTQSRAAAVVNELSPPPGPVNYTPTTTTSCSSRSHAGSIKDSNALGRFSNPARNRIRFAVDSSPSIRSAQSTFSSDIITTPTPISGASPRAKKGTRTRSNTNISSASGFSSAFSTPSPTADLCRMADPYCSRTSSGDNSAVLTSAAYPNGVTSFIPYSFPNHNNDNTAVVTSSSPMAMSSVTSGCSSMMIGDGIPPPPPLLPIISTPGSTSPSYNACVSSSFNNFNIATAANLDKTRRPRTSNPYDLAKSGRPWTERDKAILKIGKKEHKKWAVIAAKLERSDESARGFWKSRQKNIVVTDRNELDFAIAYWNSV